MIIDSLIKSIEDISALLYSQALNISLTNK
jgi:hypothetical protein